MFSTIAVIVIIRLMWSKMIKNDHYKRLKSPLNVRLLCRLLLDLHFPPFSEWKIPWKNVDDLESKITEIYFTNFI